MATRLIALTGAAGSGKSLVAEQLQDVGFTLVKFAGPLKAMLRTLFERTGHIPVEVDEMIEGGLKEVPQPALLGHTPRWAMQTLGTEWGRECFGPNFWVNLAMTKVRSVSGPVVIDDCRFPNEAATVALEGGEVWRITRPNLARNAGDHVSEAPLPPELVDVEIDNRGSADDLRAAVRLHLNAGYRKHLGH